MTKHSLRKKDKHRASARVVDGKLILSFPNAVTPVLWQMDLSEAKASALVVNPAANGEGASLALKTGRGESLSIAEFSGKEEALEGLMTISSALENAYGQIRVGQAANEFDKPVISYHDKRRGGWKFAAIIAGLIVAGVLIVSWGSLMPRPPQNINQAAYAPPPASAKDSAGVPVSADDYLKDTQ